MRNPYLVVCACAFLFLFACKKNKTNNVTPTSTSDLVGTWNMTQSQSIMKFPGGDIDTTIKQVSDVTFVFKNDYTGTETNGTFSAPLTWSLQNNDKTLTIKEDTTYQYTVVTLTKTDLALNATAGKDSLSISTTAYFKK